MSERKAVVWFGDEPKPTTFFARSLFRSWQFWMNTVFLAAVCVEFVIVVWKSDSVFSMPLYALFLLFVLFPSILAFKRHQKIQERYLSGQIASPPSNPALAELLQVADNAINEGVRNSILAFGMVLLGVLKWKLHMF
jgi:hypothetical protein